MVTYEWKNNSGKNNSFAALAHPQVFQNGQALDTAVYLDQPTGYDMNSYTGGDPARSDRKGDPGIRVEGRVDHHRRRDRPVLHR